MKAFIFLILSAVSVFAAPQAYGKLKFDPNYPLYLSDGQKFGYQDLEKAFDNAFSSNKPVILFVHGRGNEPEKSLNGGTLMKGNSVQRLEAQYGARVIMFNWKSDAVLVDRGEPLSQMPASATSLRRVLGALKIYLARKPGLNGRVSLLVHSMGSIVVENLVQQEGGWMDRLPMFSNVLFSEADADNADHWQWLSQISKVENVYVTVNRNDLILQNSFDHRAWGRKALSLNPVLPLAPQATYLDFTNLGRNVDVATPTHEVFDKEKMYNQVHLCNLLDQILKGKTPAIESATLPTRERGYQKVKFAANKADKCFSY